MHKFIIFTIIGLTLIGCKASSDNNQNNSNSSNEKAAKPLYDKYSAKQISVMNYSKLLRLGISYYKNRQNRLALPFLKEAVKHEKGKAYYYLGNVYMNLHQYEKATENYYHSNNKGYRKRDSIFNLACAYSLWHKPRFVLIALLINFKNGHKSMSRINRDTDLEFFRNSKYYKQYLKDRHFFSKGITPQTKEEFISNMLFDKYYREPEALGSSTQCKFKRDGIFFYRLPQGARESVGSWKINEKNKTLILRIEKDWANFNDAPRHSKFASIETFEDFKKANFTNLITYTVPFKNIRLKIKDLNSGFRVETSGKYEKIIIGDWKTDGISLVFGQSL